MRCDVGGQVWAASRCVITAPDTRDPRLPTRLTTRKRSRKPFREGHRCWQTNVSIHHLPLTPHSSLSLSVFACSCLCARRRCGQLRPGSSDVQRACSLAGRCIEMRKTRLGLASMRKFTSQRRSPSATAPTIGASLRRSPPHPTENTQPGYTTPPFLYRPLRLRPQSHPFAPGNMSN